MLLEFPQMGLDRFPNTVQKRAYLSEDSGVEPSLPDAAAVSPVF